VDQTFLVFNSIWIISITDKLPNKVSEPVFYGNGFYLVHKTTGKKLDIDKKFKSPVTQNAEGIMWRFVYYFVIYNNFFLHYSDYNQFHFSEITTHSD
jgi:hypothetical protein